MIVYVSKLFLYLKEKVPKRSKPTCRWIAGAHGTYITQSPTKFHLRSIRRFFVETKCFGKLFHAPNVS